MATKKTESKITFEEAMNQLEEQVTILQNGKISLEDALSAYENSLRAYRICESRLADVEQRVYLYRNPESNPTKAKSSDPVNQPEEFQLFEPK